MDIKQIEVTIAELVAGYVDNDIGGVVAYNGKLDVRPPYQREFVYKEKQRDAVISTVLKGYPLNTMYWAARDDGKAEIIDGQQRTVSVCRFCDNRFSFNNRFFRNMESDERDKILSYKLQIYLCTGTDSEKLDWFETINIAGEKLEEQELLNATYYGTWVSSARGYFSKPGCGGEKLGRQYLNGQAIRQAYLETAIKWADAAEQSVGIKEYMNIHRQDANAAALYSHFQTVINWVRATFTTYRPQMKGIDWGTLWVKHHNRTDLDAGALEAEVSRLMADDDVTSKSGIYLYVLSQDKAHDERFLSIRAFKGRDKTAAYEKQNGLCYKCCKPFALSEMEADHITPWAKGGKTIPENCKMLCKMCNRLKSDV